MLTLAQLREIFKADRFAAYAGITIEDAGPGWACTSIEIAPHHLNGLGVVQGGAIFTLADFAFAIACNSYNQKVIGISAEISWVKPAFSGTIRAHAKELSRNRKLATYDVRVTNEEGELLATFHGTGYSKNEAWIAD